MNVYIVNNELAEKLIQAGLKEFTSVNLADSGKRTFCLAKRCDRKIYFTRDRIEVINAHIVEDYTTELTDDELITVLMYLKLRPAEIERLTPRGFKIKEATRRIAKFKKDLDKKELSTGEQKKITRIVALYDEIKSTLLSETGRGDN